MQTKERFFHAILFEVIALAIVVPSSIFITKQESEKMLIIGVLLSLFSVFWNYVYNIIFDYFTDKDRINRTIKIRTIHTLGFEAGFLFVTIPLIAFILSISFLNAFYMELGFMTFFLIYSAIFNYVYDISQPYKFLKKTLSKIT